MSRVTSEIRLPSMPPFMATSTINIMALLYCCQVAPRPVTQYHRVETTSTYAARVAAMVTSCSTPWRERQNIICIVCSRK